jgi:predicted SAM-dependent methyltransferase
VKLMKDQKNKRTQLYLGSGKRNIPGFIHIDLDDYPHLAYRHNIANLPMFSDNSVDLIYTSHSFEYFDRKEGEQVLKEWRRVLKTGGILRIAVPDFEAITQVYLKYKKDLGHKGILGPLFGRMNIGGKVKNKTIYHKTVYDFNSLKKVLQSAGFKNIHRYDWEKTIHKNYDDHSQAYIPHLDKKGILISLNLEARKSK